MKNKLLIIPLLLLQFNAFAILKIIQPLGISAPQPLHELSFGVALGVSDLMYKIDDGYKIPGLSPELQLRYTYNFGYWGISTGCDFTIYSTVACLNKNFSETYEAYDPVGKEYFDFSYSFTKYRELQYAEYVCIPLLLRYRHPISVFSSWYLAAGVRLGFFINGGYRTTDYTLNTEGFYKNSDQRIYDDVPEYGFGNYKQSTSGSLDFGMTQQLVLECGIIRNLAGNRTLTYGLYATYGFNDIRKNNNELQQMVTYNGTADMTPTSVLNTYSLPNTAKASVHPLSIGVKIAYSFVKMHRKSSECFPFD